MTALESRVKKDYKIWTLEKEKEDLLNQVARYEDTLNRFASFVDIIVTEVFGDQR
jgi:hypothetical protein